MLNSLHSNTKRRPDLASLDTSQQGEMLSCSKQTNVESARTKCRLRAAGVNVVVATESAGVFQTRHKGYHDKDS